MIVEYRPSIGRVTERRSVTSTGNFSSGYLVTYASIGIPTPVMNVIIAKIRSNAGVSPEVTFDKLSTHNDYSWLPCKLPSVPLNAVANLPSGPVALGPLATVMRGARSSMLIHGTLSLRLKHTRDCAQYQAFHYRI